MDNSLSYQIGNLKKDCQKQIIQLLFLILDFAPFSNYSDDFSHEITLGYDKLLRQIWMKTVFSDHGVVWCTRWAHPDSTFYFGLRKLAPGHKMIFTIFHGKKEVFWGKNYLTFWYLQKGNYLQKGSIII